MGDCVDDEPERVVVGRNVRRRRQLAGPASVGVVVRKPDPLELRQSAVTYESVELAAPFLDSVQIAVTQVPADVVRIVEAFEARRVAGARAGEVGRVGKLAVVAE